MNEKVSLYFTLQGNINELHQMICMKEKRKNISFMLMSNDS